MSPRPPTRKAVVSGRQIGAEQRAPDGVVRFEDDTGDIEVEPYLRAGGDLPDYLLFNCPASTGMTEPET